MAREFPYFPDPGPIVPAEVQGLMLWVQRELERIAEALPEQPFLRVSELHAAPNKPRNGMIVYADGTNWNPGSGEGFYGYENGAWVKL